MKRSILLLLVVFSVMNLTAQSSIVAARNTAVGSIVTVSGIVTNGSELGTIRYIQDDSAGIAIYDSSVAYFQRGDSVSVTGELTEYANLLEIESISMHALLGSGVNLPATIDITPVEMAETLESRLVHIDSVSFADGGASFASNTSYNFTANGQTSSVFVRSNHPLIGSIIPSNQVSIIGLCSQYYSNYQLILRDSADIINSSLINIITPVEISNISTSGFDVSWITDSLGTTGILYGNTTAYELGKLEIPGTTVNHLISISGASPSEVFYLKAYSANGTDTAYSTMTTAITQSLSSGEMIAYFTRPVDNSVSNGSNATFINDAIDDTLINYIGRATESIDMAIYDFNNVDVADIAAALNNAFTSGIDIRVIYDTTWTEVNLANLLSPAIHSIVAPVTSEYGIMHNKFVIIDAAVSDPDLPIVWTGSTNFEYLNMYKFANNVIIVQDKSLAITYTLEFNEMWGSSTMSPDITESRFGPYKTDNTPHKFIIGASEVGCYFSPSDRTTSMILNTMESADDELLVNTMLITRSDIGYKMSDVYGNGVSLKVIVHDKASCSSTVVNILEGLIGDDFKEYGESEGMLHNKLMIVDPNDSSSDPTVLTGSHNWSNNAENKNDENTLIIHNATLANEYYQEFMERYNNGIPLHSDYVKITAEKEALVFPNPASSAFNIVITGSQPEDLVITVYNLEGKAVTEYLVLIANGKNTINIPVDHSSGIYFINLHSKRINETHRLEIID
jgi:phosphatidylserine/phosphatidylglycerophosphate/cardiolipin synthase-like enzyme